MVVSEVKLSAQGSRSCSLRGKILVQSHLPRNEFVKPTVISSSVEIFWYRLCLSVCRHGIQAGGTK